jgi:hypothetical protein
MTVLRFLDSDPQIRYIKAFILTGIVASWTAILLALLT